LPAALGEEVDNGRGRPAIIATNPESNTRLIAVRNGQVSGPSSPKEERPVSWKDLPHKWQLFVLTMARLSEPLTQTGLSAYLFFQLKSFDPSLSDSTIASQAGIMQGCFTGAQFFTAMLWGRAADSEWIGRKKVLLIGLFGTCLSCVGFGFSRTCLQAAVFRTLGGALNGNIGVMRQVVQRSIGSNINSHRTMISEIVKEKKFQSRAFLLMPMCFNIGVIIGPVLGGFLADPVGNYPHLFGENSLFGGKDGVWWMKHWPYALPNLISAVFLFSASAAVFFALDEVNYHHEPGRTS
jgi:MFS family permease